jgi:ubiquinone/menaquinone biosynthesis C-methylase UbiE
LADFWDAQRARVARAIGLDLTHAQSRYVAMVDAYAVPGTRWLEIGCGRQILPTWAMSPAEQREIVARCEFVAGIDLDEGMKENELLTFRAWAAGESLPFRTGAFTLATANMVIEHLADPAAVLAEVNRVLQPGGCFLFHTVNQRSLMRAAALMSDSVKVRLASVLERRAPEDVFPTHYRMNTEEDIRRFAAGTGFAVERMEYANASGFLAQLGPLGLVELPFARVMASESLQKFGTNVMVALRKTAAA